ncbi:hypothetical protein HYU06_02265 [Candidatus Woesearchaeota archaeon]|nr:hypothetical protein [Candidatus Woesearchaeota archaeon]
MRKGVKNIKRRENADAKDIKQILPDRFRKNLKLIIIFSIIGIILSLYLTYQHYKEGKDAFCQALGGGCDIVNKSTYSELGGLLTLFGIDINFPFPVAIVGLLGFIFNLVVAMILRKETEFGIKNKASLLKVMFAANLLGLIFAIFVTYVEYGILGVPCYYCDASKVSHTIIFIISAINLKYLKN